MAKFEAGQTGLRTASFSVLQEYGRPDPFLERFIRGRKSFESQWAETAERAFDRHQYPTAILAARRVLEIPDLSQFRFSSRTLAATAEQIQPGIIEEYEADRVRRLTNFTPPTEFNNIPLDEVFDIPPDSGPKFGGTLGEYARLGVYLDATFLHNFAFRTDTDTTQKFTHIEQAARDEVHGSKPILWLDTNRQLHSDGDIHGSGMALQEAGRVGLRQGMFELGTRWLLASQRKLKTAEEGAILSDSNESLTERAEIRDQRHAVLNEAVEAYSNQDELLPTDTSNLRELASDLLAMGYPPPPNDLIRRSKESERDHVAKIIDVAIMGRQAATRGTPGDRRFFCKLQDHAEDGRLHDQLTGNAGLTVTIKL